MLRRRLVAPVVLAVLPLGPAALVAASPASARPVSIQAPRVSSQPPIGSEPVTLTGSIGRTTHRTVNLQRRVGGRWQLVTRTVVGAKGRYAFRVAMPGRAASWRVVAPPVR